ncbi:arylsulfatase [Curvibacter sp. APW13]|uniref:arylsulfatase n=1 Tax=Curvibacter sp. APW13 TaxID=3077236 RepID=UPI0028DE1406|nr:arylsulfatase [Curvibacter sp. APW13]MDT8992299.1 arylsulfatase [Curvibacter sp. APW13]
MHRFWIWPRWTGYLAMAMLACSGPYCAAAATPARPNIVFILLDDAGFSDLGAYGGEIQTPHIDQLAKDGVRFTNFHTASTCESSRAMLHSGVDHHRAGAGTLQVVKADNQRGKPGYEGYLSDRVHSLGTLLRDGGYATYFAGKWNLGNGLERAPGARGWDRYIALEQTGADNFEAKVYAPLNLEAVWWEDGKRAQLPANFFSSRHYLDRLIQYIDEGRSQNKPFFATLALQAVHSPLQAPDVDIAKYKDRYAAGWDALRSERYQRQVRMGLVPAGLRLPHAYNSRPWSSLSPAEQNLYAKKMSVFAAMLDNADQHIGRLREHLKNTGQLDNTAFVVMSDNGADAYELNSLNLPFRLWYRANYALGIETLGQRGSYVHYGQDWAQVSNTPFQSFKGTSFEGGMRVPFIMSYPKRLPVGTTADSFAYATDFLPTVLDLAGIALPGDTYRGQPLLRPTGTSMLPYLEGRTKSIHGPDYSVGFEGTGADTLFQGDYKITRTGPPNGDGQWHLYHLRQDPTESYDLAGAEPERVQKMQALYERYLADNGVVKPAPGYDPLRQLLKNNWPILVQQMAGVLALTGAALAALVALVVYLWRRSRRAAQ